MVLETVTLPGELPTLIRFLAVSLRNCMLAAERAVLLEFHAGRMKTLCSYRNHSCADGTRCIQRNEIPRLLSPYLMISTTEPAPTVGRRMAKPELLVHGDGAMGTSIVTVSPGVTISDPSGSLIEPSTSVVRK